MAAGAFAGIAVSAVFSEDETRADNILQEHSVMYPIDLLKVGADQT